MCHGIFAQVIWHFGALILVNQGYSSRAALLCPLQALEEEHRAHESHKFSEVHKQNSKYFSGVLTVDLQKVALIYKVQDSYVCLPIGF